MKKSLYLAALLLTTVFASCEKDEIGGTATESMAGQWYITVDAVDENGNAINSGEDYFGYGKVQILTYNTVANTADSMWVSSNGNFDLASYYGVPSYPNYAFRVKVGINQGNLTFSSDKAENADGDYPVTITEGKILKNAGHQNNGSAADSIVFFISYEGDPWYPADGYAKYKVSGVRYSGLAEND